MEPVEVALLVNTGLIVALALVVAQMRDELRYTGMLQDGHTDLVLRLIERVRRLEEQLRGWK